MCFTTLIISFIITFQYAMGQVGDSCKNENGAAAVCLAIIDCEVALRSIVSTGQHQQLRCGFEDNIEVVCCPQNITDETQNSVNRSGIADAECEKIVHQYVSPHDVRVISGENAEPGEFPHMVALAYNKSLRSYEFRCGGSLITERYIITAAHCIGSGPIFARVGMINISDTHRNPKTDYTIEDIVVHPNYSRPLHYHDLAILRLTTPVVTSNSVYPVCLYTNEKDTNIALDITGWGRFNASHSYSNVLLKGKQTIVPQYKCNLDFRKSRRLPYGITAEQICALDTLKKTDACQGDSGGPLQGYTHSDGFYRLVGVTSFGISCATSTPGVYIRVSKYIDWIESVVWPSN